MRKIVIVTFKKLLKLDDSPHRIALAYSIGVLLAFSPLLGLHTITGLAVAFRFGLSRLAVMAGVFTNSPWTLVPYYTFATWLGSLLFSRRQYIDPAIFHTRLEDLWTTQFWKALAGHWQVLIPFFTGSTLLALLFALVAYPVSLACINAFRRRAATRSQAKQIAVE